MRVEHSNGWLLRQMVELHTDPEKWWKRGRLGFTFDGDEGSGSGWEPPEGWELLPIEGMADGE